MDYEQLQHIFNNFWKDAYDYVCGVNEQLRANLRRLDRSNRNRQRLIDIQASELQQAREQVSGLHALLHDIYVEHPDVRVAYQEILDFDDLMEEDTDNEWNP